MSVHDRGISSAIVRLGMDGWNNGKKSIGITFKIITKESSFGQMHQTNDTTKRGEGRREGVKQINTNNLRSWRSISIGLFDFHSDNLWRRDRSSEIIPTPAQGSGFRPGRQPWPPARPTSSDAARGAAEKFLALWLMIDEPIRVWFDRARIRPAQNRLGLGGFTFCVC